MSALLPSASNCCSPCDNSTTTTITLSELIIQQMTALVANDITVLRGLTTEVPFVNVLGNLAFGDGGGGLYFWDEASTATDDGQNVIRPDNVDSGDPGRYIANMRSNTSPYSIKWFGAQGVGGDDTVALQAAIAFSAARNVKLYAPAGVYGTTVELTADQELFYLEGEGPLKSIIKYIGVNPADSVLHIKHFGTNPFGYYKTLVDFGVQADANCLVALKITRCAHTHLTRITAGGASFSNIYADGIVLTNWTDISGSAQIGIVVPPAPQHCFYFTGTDPLNCNSNVFTNLIAEASTSYGIVMTGKTSQNVINGGTVESGQLGIRIEDGSVGNVFNSLDCEENVGNDLDMGVLCNFNQFNSCLFLTGVNIKGYCNSLNNCRVGTILIDSGAFHTWLVNTAWNANIVGSFTDGGVNSQWINKFDLFTAATPENRILSTESIFTAYGLDLKAGGSPLYKLQVDSRVVSAGNVAFDFVRVNQGAPTTTAMSLGVEGKVGFGFGNLTNLDALVSINGGLSVGLQRTLPVGAIAMQSYFEGPEVADPGVAAANYGRLFFRDNGAGKTQLVVRFQSGVAQVVATEP